MKRNRLDPGRQLLHQAASNAIIGEFFTCYNELGFGYLEPIYSRAMEELLLDRGLDVKRESPIPVLFRNKQIGFHRCDLLVDDAIILEIKATEVLATSVERQVRNYLRGLRKDLGIVLHFGPKPRFIPIILPESPAKSNFNDSSNSESAVPGPRAQ